MVLVTDTVEEARDWLREHADAGAKCPVCTQFTKVYRRKITSRQARALILVWREVGIDWCHVPSAHPSLAGDGGELSRLRYWGLIEEASEQRADGGRSGWWRITDAGRRYLLQGHRVPKYARLFDGRCLSLDYSEMADIRDALGTRFNYDDLMAGR